MVKYLLKMVQVFRYAKFKMLSVKKLRHLIHKEPEIEILNSSYARRLKACLIDG